MDAPIKMATRLTGLGWACMVSGIVMALIAVLSVVPSDVTKDQWSYPTSAELFLVFGLVLALCHVLSAAGFLGALLAGTTGPSRAGARGLWIAIAGLLGLSIAEIGSAFIADADVDSPIAATVGTAFGVTSLVFAAGAIVAGVVIARSGVWTGWGRWLVLTTGVVLIVLVTPANALGDPSFRMASLLLWSLLFIPIGWIVAHRGEPSRLPTSAYEQVP